MLFCGCTHRQLRNGHMTITLRSYQLDAVAAIEGNWAEGMNRPAVVIATGGGKTTIFSHLIGRHVERLRKEGKRILVLAHREELLEQAEARIKAQNPGIWTAIVKGSRGQKTHEFADVVVASVQTLARPKRREAVNRIGMVIVDECHNAASKSYKDVLAHYGCLDERATPTVGFTATLTRMNGGLPEVWQSVAYSRKIHHLIKDGFLVPPKALSVEVPSLNLASTRITGGDLNTGDLAAALEESAAFEVVAESYRTHAADRPGIVFMPNVATAQQQADAFAAVGIKAELITGEMGSQERKATYERYNSGATQVLVNCMVLTEGFDAPHTSAVVIGRPTLNPGLYIQCVGRGLRLADGKMDCLVLDIAGASLKHSLAGVNDLESDCVGRCDCNCLRCGCSDRCKCAVRQCGCDCIERHEAASKICKCAGSEDCSCGCPGDQDGTGHGACACDINPDCACRGGGEVLKDKEVSVDVLKNLTEVDILGEELAASTYTWLTTTAGIKFLPVGQDVNLFLLPSPEGDGYFWGRVEGSSPKAPVQRLDNGAVNAADARRAAEEHAATTGFTFNSRKASWRRTPASDAQIGLLRRMKVDVPAGIRKGDASDLLAVTKVSRQLDPRFSKYVRQD